MNKFLKFPLVFLALAFFACGDGNAELLTPEIPPTENPSEGEFSLSVPDKDGFNIKGVVYCDNKPVRDAVVSDGNQVVKTDEKGVYYLNSDKRRGYVFLSIPAGYAVNTDKVYPQFFSAFTDLQPSAVEQHNFELKKNDRDDYVVIGLADMHISGVRDTPRQYTQRFIPDVNQTIADFKAQGKDVYCISLGDESHDKYWYDWGIALGGIKPYLEMIDAPIFQCMGNHDNDPYIQGDFDAEETWRKEMGPSYYSFNLGKMHYVVLDNIIYVNAGASQGNMGPRTDYESRLTQEELDWLKKDLATVTDKSTPIVVCMHVPYFSRAKLFDGAQTPKIRYSLKNHADLKDALAAFSKVTILSGHAHVNSCMSEENILEHNIAAVHGSMWYTGQDHMSRNHICSDGSVGGYFVMDVNGKNYTHYYKSIGHDKNYQFRTYDRNQTFIKKTAFFPTCKRSNKNVYELFNSKEYDETSGLGCMDEWGGYYAEGASTPKAFTDNKVFINVFAWDDRWKIEVTEGGKKLPVTRVNAYDPLHIISLACKCLEAGEDASKEESITSGRLPSLTCHFFEVTASSPTSALFIKVTDPFGNVYTEDMSRPKAFNCQMN